MLAIDIGSNTLKIAYFDAFKKLKNEDFVLNLGFFHKNDNLSDEGVLLLEKCLEKLAKRFDLKTAKVVATAVFRKSKNAEKIAKRLHEKFGFKLQILSQEQEARLTRIGVGFDFDFTMVDIGGYSIEISDDSHTLLLDFGLLSFYKKYKEQDLSLLDFAKLCFRPHLEQLKTFCSPIVLASKTGIFAKSIRQGLKCDEIDDLDYHNIKIKRDDLWFLIDFLNSHDEKINEIYVGKNRSFAVLCGAYFILNMFSSDEFIISAYGLKEALLKSKILL